MAWAVSFEVQGPRVGPESRRIRITCCAAGRSMPGAGRGGADAALLAAAVAIALFRPGFVRELGVGAGEPDRNGLPQVEGMPFSFRLA
jgi:hypothetical protein